MQLDRLEVDVAIAYNVFFSPELSQMPERSKTGFRHHARPD